MMLICVDGTGPHSNENYESATRHSFVMTIFLESPSGPKWYRRGPGLTGTGPLLVTPIEVANAALNWWRQGDGKIFMTGHSRGAAIVIEAAAWLQNASVDVDALFLFDAVMRSPELEVEYIPANVKKCYHAIREPAAHSRDSFGNVGLRFQNGDRPLLRRFYTTHGAMGGIPWGLIGQEQRLREDIIATAEALSQAKGPRYDALSMQRRHSVPPTPRPMLSQRPMKQDKVIKEGIEGATNVTPEQEANGMQQVREWMWVFLRKHGVMPS